MSPYPCPPISSQVYALRKLDTKCTLRPQNPITLALSDTQRLDPRSVQRDRHKTLRHPLPDPFRVGFYKGKDHFAGAVR